MSAQNTSTLKDEPLSPRARASLEASQARGAAIPELNDKGRMADIPLSPEAKIIVERRGESPLRIAVEDYGARLATWAQWQQIAAAAQGTQG